MRAQGRVSVQTVFAGFAAFTSGIKAGDRLESVDGISVYTLEPAELKALTMGREGTNALVRVRRGEDVFEVCLFVHSIDFSSCLATC